MTQIDKNNWLVMKLGGSSVASVTCWNHAIDAVRTHREHGRRVMIVHSALAGVTDLLERWIAADGSAGDQIAQRVRAMHQRLADEMGVVFSAALEELLLTFASRQESADLTQPKAQAQILALGELMASELVVAYFEKCGMETAFLDARHALRCQSIPGENDTGHYLSALGDVARSQTRLETYLPAANVVVTQGFIASDERGATVVLGRGGSDTSAAYFGAALHAQAVEIWTDVPGLFSADPRAVPNARLLTHLDYAEAQEIVTCGAKVLHPRAIGPLQRLTIPIRIVYASNPALPGTSIGAAPASLSKRVKAVTLRQGVVLISMESVSMWQQVGFLADVFACFKRFGFSIDMVSTSETSVTVTLDPLVNPHSAERLDALLDALNPLCKARAISACAAISLVGTNIRANLHQLAPALSLFEERDVHMVSQAANDLNLTFVVDELDAPRLVKALHAQLIQAAEGDQLLGATWDELQHPREMETQPWWRKESAALLDLAASHTPVYVYQCAALEAAVAELAALSAADRIFYAVKANSHAGIIETFARLGLGFECVSPGELRLVREAVPDISGDRLLYTLNFAACDDYVAGFDAGAWVTLDNLYPLQHWPKIFCDRDILLRVDPGLGAGHHRHVRTAGAASKFGIGERDLDQAQHLAARAKTRIVGLHMHLGSGIHDVTMWQEQGVRLAGLARQFPDVRLLDLGGGMGIAERQGERGLDLRALDQALQAIKQAAPDLELWLEPGRFLVARAGVLLARVTQTKGKGEVRYLGTDAGMNSFIRPALYGAHHPIVNLSRLEEETAGTFNVVGPICETGDVLGRERRLPEPHEGDVLLIANAGAYGRVMSSSYNAREPAEEVMI